MQISNSNISRKEYKYNCLYVLCPKYFMATSAVGVYLFMATEDVLIRG